MRSTGANTVPERYLKALNYLADTTGETAYLSAWRRGEIVVLATVEGSQAVRVVGLTAGYSENIHARASGKLLLAYSPEETREQTVKSLVLRRLTDATITSRAALRRGNWIGSARRASRSTARSSGKALIVSARPFGTTERSSPASPCLPRPHDSPKRAPGSPKYCALPPAWQAATEVSTVPD